jgi:hypothetical protein
MSNPAYFKCKECNGIRYKKMGTNRKRRYKCLRCGTEHTSGHGFKAKKGHRKAEVTNESQ